MPPRIKIKLPPKAPFKRIGIAGLGLIGGSLAKALRPVAGINLYAFDFNLQTLDDAKKSRHFEAVTSDRETFAAWPLDLAYLCLPVAKNIEFINFLGDLKVDFPITDAGSTKSSITEAALKNNLVFCGGHPVAGREVSGYINAEASLIKGCLYILTPDQRFGKSGQLLAQKLHDLHLILNCQIEYLNPKEHDRIYCLVSHLVQLSASSLARTIFRLGGDDSLKWSGTGFRDSTRVAGSDPDKWAEILLDNAENLVLSLEENINILSELKEVLAAKNELNLKKILTESSLFRNKLPELSRRK